MKPPSLWGTRLAPTGFPDAAAALAAPAFAIGALHCTDHGIADDCRYQVAWSINPHMTIGSVDFAQAATEHAAFSAALQASGARLEQLPFVHGAYDSVFVKDPALLLSRRGRRYALLARFHHRERVPERTARAHSYAQHGYEIVSDDRGPHWEGGDVVMWPSSDGMFLGHGFRSERAAAAWLERHAAIPVVPLELVDPHLYHLDTALAILPNGIALVCPSAFTAQSLRSLEQLGGLQRVVMVSRQSALGFALNFVASGNTIVLGSRDLHLEMLVESLGYHCVVAPLSQFQLAGGSAACLVATVHRDPPE